VRDIRRCAQAPDGGARLDPRATTLAVIPCIPSSSAIVRVMPISAAFDAE
jgi:hypothetical protein